MYINDAQREYLLRPLAQDRVAKRSQAGRSLSYVEVWDIKRTLIRVFGFGGWSWTVTTAELAFEDTVAGKSGGENWNVGYKVIGTLTVGDAQYAEAAVGSATLPSRGDAHDMAIKTAESDALKRAAINLGTQFGLSLYNDGALNDVVGRTLDIDTSGADIRSASVITGETLPAEAAPVEPKAAVPADDEGAEEWAGKFRAAMLLGDVASVIQIKMEMQAEGAGDLVFNGKTLNKIADIAVIEAGKRVTAAEPEEGGAE